MKFDTPITGYFAKLLTEKAMRPDLVIEGVEIDDACFQRHLRETTIAHPHRSQEQRVAIAAYAAYFDQHAPHNVAKGLQVPEGLTAQETHQALFNAQRRGEQATRELMDRHLQNGYATVQGLADSILTANREALAAVKLQNDWNAQARMQDNSETRRLLDQFRGQISLSADATREAIHDLREAVEVGNALQSDYLAFVRRRDRFEEWLRWVPSGLLLVIAGELAWSLIR